MARFGLGLMMSALLLVFAGPLLAPAETPARRGLSVLPVPPNALQGHRAAPG